MMIIVNVNTTWPDVQEGKVTPEYATLRAWHGIGDKALERYADAILGIYQGEVVSAYDITGWQRHGTGRTSKIEFTGVPSKRWAHLIGTPNPGEAWRRGQQRPVKYKDTTELM